MIEQGKTKRVQRSSAFGSARFSGFTLIELLVVVSIIGILSSIIFVSLRESKMKSRDSKRISDIYSIANAINLYQASFQRYPVQTEEIPLTGMDGVSLELKVNNYISMIPLDPLNGQGEYKYYYRSDGNVYTLRFCQEKTSVQGLSDGCANVISP